MPDNKEASPAVSVLQSRMDSFERQCSEHRKQLNGNLTRIWETLNKIQDEIHKRPTWIVSGVFAFLTGTCGILTGVILRFLL